MDAAPVIQVLRSLRSRAGGPLPELSDGQLLAHFVRCGDAAAFAELVRRHGPMVLGVCRRLLRDAHDADDAFQATFLVLVRKAARLRDPESLGPWLYGVAYRTALRCRMRSARRRAQERPLGDLPADDPIDTDLGGALDDAIHRLPAKYRAPFVLCHLEGLTQAQAARRLGCPPATVATRLMRARQRLRSRLAEQGVAPAAVVLPVALVGATARAAADLRAGRALAIGVAELMKGAGMTILGRTRAVLLATMVFAVGGGTGLVAMRAPAADDPPPKVVPPVAVVPQPAPPTVAEKPEEFRTPNFAVTAPNAGIARLIGEAAERARKEQALAWLGHELPRWPKPCPARITIRISGAGGATEFDFADGKVRGQSMHLEGPLDRLLLSCLPHEVTHMVLAHHFGRQIPRWADEGAAIMAEDQKEQKRHEDLARTLLDQGRGMRLAALFKLTDYPQDVMVLFAEGYSITRFLVERGGRPRFIAFLKDGMDGDWDKAVQAHYSFKSVDELEHGWLASLRLEHIRTMRGARKQFITYPPPSTFVAGRAMKDPGSDAIIVTIFEPILHYEAHTTKRPDGNDVTEYWLNSGESRQTFRLTEVRGHTADGALLSPAQLAERLRHEIPVFLGPDGGLIDSTYRQLLKPDTIILSIGLPPHTHPAR